MSTLEQAKADLLSDFELFDDWMDKYNFIIDMGKESKGVADEFKTNQYLISGCQSQVWLTARYENQKVFFNADSDAIITKGIVQLLIKVVDGQSPQAIIDEDFSFIDSIGLKEHLSPTRSNGLTSMIKQIKLYALVFKTKEQQL